MNNSAAAASSTSGSVNPPVVDEMETLRAGLELARASQLTLLRLQLALQRSNRRTAMQALDNLLEIDAEMEGLAAKLNGAPSHLAGDAALFSFIGFQKEAIATEKHVLASGELGLEARPIVVPADDDDEASGADLPAQEPDDEAERIDRGGSRAWIYVLAAAILIVAIGCGLIAYFWPVMPIAEMLPWELG